MHYLLPVLFALFLGTIGTALAEPAPDTYARFSHTDGQMVQVRVTYRAPDTCQAILSAKRGAPPGQQVGTFVIPVTIVIGRNPKGCGGDRVLHRLISVGGGANAQNVRVFWVDTTGKILDIRDIYISY